MKIETLKERISKAEQKIESKRNTIAKKTAWIAKRKAKDLSNMTENERYWETCEINNLEEDIMRLEREIKEVETSLEGYRTQMTAELEKAASRNVPAIVEFLDRWQKRVFNFYNMGLVPCYELKSEYIRLQNECKKFRYLSDEWETAYAAFEPVRQEYREKISGYYEEQEMISEYTGRPYKKSVKVAEGEWEYIHPYECKDTYEEAAEWLRADLKHEANRKYDFIIERVNAICGKITDASGLTIGAKQDLNGYIIGEKGTAHVQTIGAGGYNIQCYHFRTLIHKAK